MWFYSQLILCFWGHSSVHFSAAEERQGMLVIHFETVVPYWPALKN